MFWWHELMTQDYCGSLSQITTFRYCAMMFARKRRGTTYSKHFISHEQDSFNNTQKCEPLNHTKNGNYEVKSTGSSNFEEKFEFSLADIKNWESFIHFMYRPMDPASLGLIRIMFGKYNRILFISDCSFLDTWCVCKHQCIKLHTVIIAQHTSIWKYE